MDAVLESFRRHFTEDQFENRRQDKKRPLRWDAVPTMFSHPPSTKCRSTKIIAHPREPIDYVEDPFDEDTKTTDEAFNFLHDVKQTMIPGKVEAYNEEKLEVIKKEIEETFDCDKYGEIKTEYSYEIPTNGKLEEEMGPEGKNPSTSSDATILRSMLSKGASKKKTNKTDKMLRKGAKKLHKEGEYSTFGQYIAGELEDMPTQMAIYCKRIVNEAILLAQIGHLNESSKIVSCFIDPLMVE